MAEGKDLQALGKITSEVDDSNVKIILSSQCIKAQIFLVDRLRKESERQKEICKYTTSGNLKLYAEIKHAEQELKSLMTAYETVKMSNVDLKKEFLLATERKLETSERVKFGEAKYEQLWLQCKKRYESIPLVQKWFEYTNKTETHKERIKFLHQEIKTLTQETKTKKDILRDEDKKRLLKIATFLVNERPKQVQEVQEKMTQVKKLFREIEEYNKEHNATRDAAKQREQAKAANNITLVDGDWPSLCDSFHAKMSMLQLGRNDDLDMLNVNLEQIKRDVVTPIKTKSQEQQASGNQKLEEDCHASSFFNKSYLPQETDNTMTVEEETNKFARNKLIHILEDIAVDKKEAQNILSTVDSHDMQEVTEIGANMDDSHNETGTEIDQTRELSMECEEIEEIDMSSGKSNNIVIPPPQFMDFSQGRGNAIFQQEVAVPIHSREAATLSSQSKTPQDGSQKKRVVFDLPPIQEVPEEGASVELTKSGNEEAVTVTSQLNASCVSDDSFSNMKDMILRKHKLDLSPDFVYAKKTAMITDDPIITSKFFKNNEAPNKTVEDAPQAETNKDRSEETQKKSLDYNPVTKQTKDDLKAEDMIDLSAKYEEKVDKTVSGFLFMHGPHGIPESLDVSISTTGFEDGDGDFPHCIDSSLLLSPKADLPIPVSGTNNEVYSQEVPNFLSGLRKTGFSFFGKSEGSQPDSSAAPDGNNFNFNFNKGDDKKSRGGLFSMFQ